MAARKSKARSSAALPVEQRRGVTDRGSDNSWDAVLVRHPGGPAAILDALRRREVAGAVRATVTADLFARRLAAPGGGWSVLVTLAGQPWSYVSPCDDWLVDELARVDGAAVIRTGYQDTANATYFSQWDAGEKTIAFETTGFPFTDEDENDGPDGDPTAGTTFHSARHPADWWRQFAAEREAIDGLTREAGAYVPIIYAYDDGGVVRLSAQDAAAVAKAAVERVDLLVWGPPEAMTPTGASAALAAALEAGDVAGVRAAVAAGADLRFLPGTGWTPLASTIERARADRKHLPLLDAILDAGVDVNYAPRGQDPPLIVALDDVFPDAGAMLPVLERLMARGARLDVRGANLMRKGQTPLHVAAAIGQRSLVQFLLAAGADPMLTDGGGRTPRRALEEMADTYRKYAEQEPDPELLEMIELLKRAESGGAADDWRAAGARDAARATRQRRKRKVAAVELAAGLQALVEAFETIGATGTGRDRKDDGAASRKGAKRKPAAAAGDLERVVAKAAALAMPRDVHVRPNDRAAWADAPARDKVVRQLRKAGYQPIGTFTVDEWPAVRMYALLSPEDMAYAAVCEAGEATQWTDLVRYHRDGTVLTVTNAPTLVAAQVDVPKFPKLRLSGAPVARLLAALRGEPPPKAGVEPIAAEEFAARVARYVSEETVYRKRAARRPRDKPPHAARRRKR